VTVVHITEPGGDGRPSDDGDLAIDTATTTLGGLGIEAAARRAEASGGGVGATIVDLAHDSGADTIVVGSRGLSGSKAVLVGSVTHDVIHFFRGCIVVAR
jgi:nucleotide-binding universal stress UspA family protein